MDEINAVEVLQSVLRLGQRTAVPHQLSDTASYAVVPNDCSLVDLAKFTVNDRNARPIRIKQSVEVEDAVSFVEYYDRFSDESTAVFASQSEFLVRAILDYHEAEGRQPRWGQHLLTLKLVHSERWKAWLGKNNVAMDQTAFCEFLEQNGMDVSTPSPADMRDVARDLRGTTEVEFGSSIRHSDGQVQLTYTENTKTSGGGDIAVPEKFVITLSCFIGEPNVDMEALLRVRCQQGGLKFWYTLLRPEETARKAFADTRDGIAATLSIDILNGRP